MQLVFAADVILKAYVVHLSFVSFCYVYMYCCIVMVYYVWYWNYVAHNGIWCEYVSSCHVLVVVTSSLIEFTHVYDFIIIGSSFQLQGRWQYAIHYYVFIYKCSPDNNQ
jgi:hypothetical protein